MDYEDLLRRYIAHVVAEEGADFLGSRDRPGPKFTLDEWHKLHELADRPR